MLENIIESSIERKDGSPRAILVEINQLYEFSRLVRTLGTGHWIFRGHADKSWSLASSLERQMTKGGRQITSSNRVVQNALNARRFDKYRASDEMYAIDLFKRHARTKLPNLEHLVEWLAAMQHYGTCTRLLDFTRSLYVALYFALENKQSTSDKAIYAIRYSDLLHNDMLSKDIVSVQRSVFAKNSSKNSTADVEQYIRENFNRNRKELQDALIALADNCIKKRDNKVGIIPVNVPGVNERLVAQSGLFLMPKTLTPFSQSLAQALNLTEKDIKMPTRKYSMSLYPDNKAELESATLIKIIIPNSLSTAMWNMLAQANVSALNLFPGLEGIAKSITYDEVLYE